MGRFSICPETGLRKGAWSIEEDRKLTAYVTQHGPKNWRKVPVNAGLSRCGKSCRLRWMNYLRSDLKRGNFSKEEDQLIIDLHSKFGNRWSAVASNLPGRTDNEIKNRWHTHLKKPKTASSGARKKAVPNSSVNPDNARSLIIESSELLRSTSQTKSCDFSYSSVSSTSVVGKIENPAITCNSEVSSDAKNLSENKQEGRQSEESEITSDTMMAFGGNFWNEPFVIEDSMFQLEEALYWSDGVFYNSYDMDMLWNQ